MRPEPEAAGRGPDPLYRGCFGVLFSAQPGRGLRQFTNLQPFTCPTQSCAMRHPEAFSSASASAPGLGSEELAGDGQRGAASQGQSGGARVPELPPPAPLAEMEVLRASVRGRVFSGKPVHPGLQGNPRKARCLVKHFDQYPE